MLCAIEDMLVHFVFDGTAFREVRTVQADFDKQDPILSVISLSPTNKAVATGGEDGVVRLWPFPSLQSPNAITDAGSKVL